MNSVIIPETELRMLRLYTCATMVLLLLCSLTPVEGLTAKSMASSLPGAVGVPVPGVGDQENAPQWVSMMMQQTHQQNQELRQEMRQEMQELRQDIRYRSSDGPAPRQTEEQTLPLYSRSTPPP